jgi:hypothetical protein
VRSEVRKAGIREILFPDTPHSEVPDLRPNLVMKHAVANYECPRACPELVERSLLWNPE